MHTVKTDIKIDYKAVCTLNGQNVDCILEDICDACHEGIEEISYIRQTIDEGGDEDIPNTVETWRDNAEYLEGILCRILEILGDYIAWLGLLGLMKGLETDGRYECRAVYWFDN